MEPIQKLKELEGRVVAEALEQLESEVSRLEKLGTGKIQNAHIEKAVKLCHQVRSIIGIPVK